MARDITKLHPELQEIVAKLQKRCEKEGLKLLITSCIRNAEEQLDCYNRGTSSLKYPNSMHNWGVAIDFCKNVKGHEYDDAQFFSKVGAIGKELGLIWGGDWTKPDRPHLQMADWGTGASTLKKTYGTPEKFMVSWSTSGGSTSASIPSAVEMYKVKIGDTLSTIGTKLGVDWKEISNLNGIKSPYTIKVGQVLKIAETTYMEIVGCTALRCRRTMNGDTIGYFANGTKVEVLDQSNNSWYKVKGKSTAGKTITGYCGSKYLK